MKRIFGSTKPGKPAPTLDDASTNIGARGDKLDEQIRKLDEQLLRFKQQIKATRPGPSQETLKRRALAVLKQKKLYEGQRDMLYGQQFNVEQTKFQVDSIGDTVSTVQAMKGASTAMKAVMKKNKELDISYIEKMQDELQDMTDVSTEINEILGRSYELPEDVDESDLMNELDMLEDEMLHEDPAGTSSVPSYLQEPELEDLPPAPMHQQPYSEQELPPMRN